MHGRDDQLDAVSVWLLGAWAGALIMTGASAAIIFPEIRNLGAGVPGLVLPADEHWKYIAGRVQNRVFGVCDWVQLLCGVGVLALGVVAAFRQRGTQIGAGLWRLRVGVTILTLGALATYLAWLAPAMQSDLRAFWQALEARDLSTARAAQDSFDRYHPIASKWFSGMLLGVVTLGIITALGIGRGATAQHRTD